jgi:hypothetical protein
LSWTKVPEEAGDFISEFGGKISKMQLILARFFDRCEKSPDTKILIKRA